MTYGSSLVNWLRSNCNSNACSHLGIFWDVMFPFGVWSIWLHRNKVVFGGNNPPKLNSYEVITKAAEFAFLGVNGKNVRVKTTVQVRWTSPRCSGLNSIRMDLQWATRDVRVEEASLGMRRVSGSKGMRDLLETRLALLLNCWALRDGIQLCLELNLPAVIIELDAMLVVNLLRSTNHNPNGNNNLVADCREGLARIPKVKIQHCYREANKCVDALARRGALLPCNFLVLILPQ